MRLAVGAYLNPASVRSSGQGEVCGHRANEVRRLVYVDILGSTVRSSGRMSVRNRELGEVGRIRRSSKRIES